MKSKSQTLLKNVHKEQELHSPNLDFNNEADYKRGKESLQEHKESVKHKNSTDDFQELSSMLHEDNAKGFYSLGYMEVKMKSNSQWTKMYIKIVKGCLLFYKSIRVIYNIWNRITIFC